MGKLVTYIGYIVLIAVVILGIPNMVKCVDYLLDKSAIVGSPTQLEKEEINEDSTGYSITYDLDGGVTEVANPIEYGLFTETFTLNNPVKDGYEFIGWTGSNGEKPQLIVTICIGSCGNLEFKANYTFALNTPHITITDNIVSWDEIEHADTYIVNVNGTDVAEVEDLEYNLRNDKKYFIDGVNFVKVKSCANDTKKICSDFSNTVYYSTSKLNVPVVTFEDFNLSWNVVENAEKYIISIGAYSLETSNTNINLLNYDNMVSYITSTTIRVQAVAFENSDFLNSSMSEVLNYTRPKFDDIILTLNDNILTWNYDSRVQEYSIKINGELVRAVYINEFNVLDLNSYFVEGTNLISIYATGNGYNIVESNLLIYVYHDLSQYENLTLTTNFRRTSSTYQIYSQGEMALLSYSYNGDCKGGFVHNNVYSDDLTIEEIFMECINPSSYSIMKFNNCTEFEIIEMINNAYVDGETVKEFDISGKIQFIVDDTLQTTYIPEKVTLTVNYGSMFNETPFYEGCTVDIIYCQTANTSDVVQYQIGSNYYNLTSLLLVDVNNVKYRIDYVNYYKKGIEKFAVLENGTKTEYTLIEFDNLLKDKQFYLNCDYYFKIKGSFSDFIKAYHSYVQTSVYGSSGDWTYGDYRTGLTFNLNNYFDVYTVAGEKVIFDFNLKLTFSTNVV